MAWSQISHSYVFVRVCPSVFVVLLIFLLSLSHFLSPTVFVQFGGIGNVPNDLIDFLQMFLVPKEPFLNSFGLAFDGIVGHKCNIEKPAMDNLLKRQMQI